MENYKVLYVSQNITPFLPETPMGKICRHLPQEIQELGHEIRTFMPRFGNINERRNNLHEVIRLSGMNLIINDNDNPLIIKVASIPQARMQVYFIDNEDFFKRKYEFRNKKGKFDVDNDERVVFFARGVIETVKQLGWKPDIIHCHGWFSALTPVYLRTAFKEEPLFSNAKIIYSLYDDDFTEALNPDFINKIKYEDITDKDLPYLKDPNYVNLLKTAIDYSDALVYGVEKINDDVDSYVKKSKKPVLQYKELDTFAEHYHAYYLQVLK